MSVEFIFRIVGMIVLGVAGGYFGAELSQYNPVIDAIRTVMLSALIGALAGIILTPYVTTRPARALRSLLGRVAAETSLFRPHGTGGRITHRGPALVPVVTFAGTVWTHPAVHWCLAFRLLRRDVVRHASGRHHEFVRLVKRTEWRGRLWFLLDEFNRTILLDTSVIIDGRVADIARVGFLPGTLLVPRFVLNELQYIADSPDGLRRQRGRRGMEVLSELQKLPNILVRVSDIDVEGVREVDDKLIVLGKQLKSPVLTNDYNLNRIAELQGVTVLNINELANAVKSVVLPGEILKINIFQEGKEMGQGVGYMDDGTMVVIENGKDYIGEYMDVQVTKVLQTAAGRMIFARVEEENGKRRKLSQG